MQHAWLLALLALPAARAVACECDEWRNGATSEDPALCRKLEGGDPARAEEESAAAAAGGAVERAAGEAERQAEDGRQQQEARGAPRQPGVEQGLELKM